MVRRITVGLVVLLLSASPAFAATWYVATTGSDAVNCTQAQNISTPKLTIAAAIACVGSVGTDDGAGDTVQVAAGTYNESLVDTIPSGTSGNPFTLTCVANLACTIANDPDPITPDYGFGWNIGSHYITINGFRFTGHGGFTSSSSFGGHHHIVITNNEFFNIPNGNSVTFSGTDDATFSGNSIHDIGSSPFTFPCGTGGYCVGLYIASKTRRFTVSGNSFANVSGYTVQIYSDTDAPEDVTVSGNTITGTIVASGIILYGTGHRVFNNVIYANGWEGVRNWSSGALIDFNTVALNENDGNESHGGIADFGNGATCRSNLVLSNGGSQILCNTTANNITSGTHFVNAAAGDFHLLDTSTAIGAGATLAHVSIDKDGVTRVNPPAVGAYEAPSGSGPLDPLVEAFTSCTTGASIAGCNGGTGWTQSWEVTAGTVTVETAGCSLSGKALRINSNALALAERNFAAHTGDFLISFKVCSSITNPDGDGARVWLKDPGGTVQALIILNSAGNITSSTQTLGTYSANTAKTVDVHFDTEGHPGQYQTRLDGGSYSAWENCHNGGACASIARFGALTNAPSSTPTFWVDDIADVAGSGGSGTLTLESPGTNGTCVSGSACLISWASNGITGNVNLFYLVGGNAYAIATVDVAATPHSWTVNAPASTAAQIRVSQGAVTDDGDTFTIYGSRIGFIP